MKHFADNLARLAGIHRLSMKDLADLLGMSQSALAKWASGDRRPSFDAALAAGDLFEVRADHLAREPFESLLPVIADAERFRAVEARLERRHLRAVETPKGNFGIVLSSSADVKGANAPAPRSGRRPTRKTVR